jgi:asparaginyl-tRNA synthetase
MIAPKIYTCEVQGHDIEGNGTEKMPFQTVLKAIEKDPKANILVRKVIADGYQPVAKAALKKAMKMYEVNLKKAQKAAERAVIEKQEAASKAAAEQEKLEEAKKIVLKENPELPAAKKVDCLMCHALKHCDCL